ncbi:MAG: hypothetical protein AB1566_12730 [Chloroflexota bacterium]
MTNNKPAPEVPPPAEAGEPADDGWPFVAFVIALLLGMLGAALVYFALLEFGVVGLEPSPAWRAFFLILVIPFTYFIYRKVYGMGKG